MIAKRQNDDLAGVPDDVLALTDDLQITPALQSAIALVRETIPDLRELTVYKDSDADESGEWVVIEVISGATVDAFMKGYNSCIDQWVVQLPQEALRKIRIAFGLT